MREGPIAPANRVRMGKKRARVPAVQTLDWWRSHVDRALDVLDQPADTRVVEATEARANAFRGAPLNLYRHVLLSGAQRG